MNEQVGGLPSSFASSSTAPAANGSCERLFSQFKQLLDSAEAKVTGYDELHNSLQKEKRSVEHLQQALVAQQQQIDTWAKQDSLVERLTHQLEAKSCALEALEAKLHMQGRQYDSAQAEVSSSQQELGRKRQRVNQLEADGARKQQKIEQLEHELQGYRGICSYVTSHIQVYSPLLRLPLFDSRVDTHVCLPYPASLQTSIT